MIIENRGDKQGMYVEFSVLKIILVIVGCCVCAGIVWRLLSRRYTLPCPVWLGWLVEHDNPFSTINRAATIIHHIEIEPGMVVLDVGCGPGRLTIPLAKAVGSNGNVVALDIQEEMLNRVQKKAQAAHLINITFLHTRIGENKLPQSTFDRALLVTVLGEIPNREEALKEIFNALKPGGVLSVTEIIFDPHFQRRSVVLKLAEAVGFHEKAFFGNSIAFTLNLEKPV